MSLRAAPTTGLVLALLLVTAAACGTGMPPSATGSPTPGATATGGPTVIADPQPTPVTVPTAVPDAEPPAALLVVGDGGPVPGALGTSCWGNACSDAPWIPGADAGTAAPGDTIRVTFRPALGHTEWTTGWARLVGGQPQVPVAGAGGGDGAVEAPLPDEAGDWSLQLFARFGAGQDAAWYWRLEVVP